MKVIFKKTLLFKSSFVQSDKKLLKLFYLSYYIDL
ncbi:hypothetical protein BM1374166_01112 [Bartonella tribocorum]|nr:hypothetical protein BM1374166_01112 [Bartonella tribocorum]